MWGICLNIFPTLAGQGEDIWINKERMLVVLEIPAKYTAFQLAREQHEADVLLELTGCPTSLGCVLLLNMLVRQLKGSLHCVCLEFTDFIHFRRVTWLWKHDTGQKDQGSILRREHKWICEHELQRLETTVAAWLSLKVSHLIHQQRLSLPCRCRWEQLGGSNTHPITSSPYALWSLY